jgi:hypothetical protein
MAIREELSLGLSNWKRGMDEARSDVRRFATDAKKEVRTISENSGGRGGGIMDSVQGQIAGAVSIGTIVAGVRAALEEAQQLSNLSVSLNESVESLGKVSFAAKALGMDFHTVAELGRELEDRLGDLGNTEPVEVMERFGLSIEELMAMPLEQKLLTIAEAFEKSRGDGVAYSDLLKLLGDSVGEQLLPLLGQGKEALEAMFDEAPQRSEEMISSMARMNEEIKKMTEGAKEFGSRYVGSILGVGQFLTDAFNTGSFEDAYLMEADRQIEFAQRQARNQDMAEAKAEAIGLARQEETEGDAAAKAEADELSAADKAEEEIIKERKRRADQRERDAEAFEKASFARLDPDGQMKILRDRIAESLGVETVGSSADIAAGAQALADQGRFATANNVLGDLAQLEAIAGRQSGSDASGGGAQGSFATLMDQVFGRGTPEQQLDATRRQVTLQEDQVRRLDAIITKMDKPAERDIFTDFP